MDATNLAARAANAIHGHGHRVSQYNDQVWGELGAITSSGDLQLAQTGFTIPQGQFLVARHLRQETNQDALVGTTITDTSQGTTVNTWNVQHHHANAPLKPGDQVVVMWVDFPRPRAVVVAAL